MIKKQILLLSIVIIIIAGCEKVVKIDLNSAKPKYVIEGSVTNTSDPFTVSITTTKNFDEDNNFPGVANANVTISDNAGNSEQLSMISLGVYKTSTMIGVPGRTYYLNVDINGQKFDSFSQMPFQVNIDTVVSYDFTDIGTTIKAINVSYYDPLGQINFYKYNLIVNKKRAKRINLYDDRASDGNYAFRPLFYFENNERLKSGDSVTVEMLCIDKGVYTYFYSLDQTINQSAAAPANPISNISGGALGYFSAHTKEIISLVVN